MKSSIKEIEVTDIEKRFWNQVSRGNKSKCWEWNGGKYPNGYGRANINGCRLGAHRLSYMLSVGHIDSGMVIHHKCGNRLCCNPNHLASVTPQENTRSYFNGY